MLNTLGENGWRCGDVWQRRRRGCKIVSGVERWQVLEQVDKELSKGDERAALNLVRANPTALRCFGAARQVINYLLLYSSKTLFMNS